MTVLPSSSRKELPAGIYCPAVTFFKPTIEQELDIETHVRHMEFLAKSGLHGVVLQGSSGEAVTLNREERIEVSTALLH
jgi:4-hydroxy-2-oxoglutarate aldolase